MVISDSTALGHFLWVLFYFIFFLYFCCILNTDQNCCASTHQMSVYQLIQFILWLCHKASDEDLMEQKTLVRDWMLQTKYTSESQLCSEDGCRVKAGSGRPSMSFLKYGGYLLYSPCSLKLVHIFFVFSSLSFSED